MLAAVARALEIRAAQGIEGIATEEQVDCAIRAAGLTLREDRPYPGEMLGRLFRRTVCVKKGLWPDLRRVVKAHELGHHVLGHGGGLYLKVPGGERPVQSAEAAAQIFGWTLLVGRPAPTHEGLDAQVMAAAAAGISIDFLFTGLSILTYRTPAVRGTPLLALA